MELHVFVLVHGLVLLLVGLLVRLFGAVQALAAAVCLWKHLPLLVSVSSNIFGMPIRLDQLENLLFEQESGSVTVTGMRGA